MSAHDEWPVIGAALGFPPVSDGDASRPPRCAPATANRLQQLYNDVLRHFDQVYINASIARLRTQASGRLAAQHPQPQAQPQQPTEVDYQALLASERGFTTPQRNFVSPATLQSNLTQISSHVPANGLPPNGVLGQINGAPPQQSPRITHPPSQQPIQSNKLPPLSEDRFKVNFMQFNRSKGIRLNERDLAIEGRAINLWALHRRVFLRNGFDSVRLQQFFFDLSPTNICGRCPHAMSGLLSAQL